MFGKHTSERSVLRTTEEGVKQFEIASQEIQKLADITKTGWHLTSANLFDKVCVISFLEGSAITAAGIAAGVMIADQLEKRRMNKKLKNAEQNSNEESP